MTERRTVDCRGCTACCRHDLILLHPESGDDPTQYETMPFTSPVTFKPGLALKRAPNGDCIYLDRATGCTIWDRAPVVCREFDCTRMYERFGAARIRKAIAAGLCSQEVADAGRKRLKNRRI
jgi:Fe-S-cluster containining protein